MRVIKAPKIGAFRGVQRIHIGFTKKSQRIHNTYTLLKCQTNAIFRKKWLKTPFLKKSQARVKKVKKDKNMEKPQVLIQIKNRKIGELRHDSVDARELHSFLESKQEFSNWIKNRIEKYQFTENEDYIVFDKSVKNPKGGRPEIDYILTLDMAKELGMLEANQKGKQIRKYFIEVEKYAYALAEKREEDLKEKLKNKESIEFYSKRLKETKKEVKDLKDIVEVKYLATFANVHKLFYLTDLYVNVSKSFVAAIEDKNKKEMFSLLNTRQEELLNSILEKLEEVQNENPELQKLDEYAQYYTQEFTKHLKIEKKG